MLTIFNMLSLSNLCKTSSVLSCFYTQARNKTKVHWAKQKKKNSPKYKAMDHFDDFYGSVFGDKWKSIREALLRKSKYVAVVNNYGDTEETIEFLTNRGAHCLKHLMSVQREFHKQYSPQILEPKETSQNISNKMLEEYSAKLNSETIRNIYPEGHEAPEKLDFSEVTAKETKKVADSVTTSYKPLEQSLLDAEIDDSRIIDPSMGLTADSLYQFIPATKLKGLEDWVSESVHYSFYSKAKDFPLLIEPDSELEFPEHLKVYTYEMESENTMFPEPRRCKTGVYDYYPMDGGSVFSVLALGVCAGDRVLDLCSAPGGKALVALQTLLPEVVVCNDVSISRCNRIQNVFKNYLHDFETSNKWRERVVLSRVDGREFTDDHGFDKVLVDVPCTIDRHSVNEDENNIFRPDRIRERLRIPELQTQLLVNALKLVRVGGTVVYSTCSLSPVQNDGVVHAALKQAFDSYNVVATIRNMSTWWSSLSSTAVVCAGAAAPHYGQLVLPDASANYGPTYVAKLVRVK